MNCMETKARPGSLCIERLAALTMADLPPATQEQAARVLLDNLACGFHAADLPWGRIIADHVIEEGSSGGATVFGRKESIGPAGAATANGTAIHGFELDDIILGSLAHPGTVVVPAALAIAEHTGASVERLLLGIVAGYEMMARLGAALGEDCNTRGFHTTGVAGAIAAAVAAGVVLGFDADTLKNAIGIACSSASGIKAFTQGTGGMVKRLHGGHASGCGVTAVQLAARGFTGPMEALDGRYGLLEVIGGPTAEANLLYDGWGENWAIGRVWTKVYSCCGVIHSAMNAIEIIRTRDGVSAADVKTLHIGIGKRAVEQNGERAPKEAMSAQYSLPFCAAVAITGDIRDPGSFDQDKLSDPTVLAMIPRVITEVDAEVHKAYPQLFGAKVTIETLDGSRFAETIWNAHGTAASPCSDEEIFTKFNRMTATCMTDATRQAVLDAVQGIANGSGSVQSLSRAMRGA